MRLKTGGAAGDGVPLLVLSMFTSTVGTNLILIALSVHLFGTSRSALQAAGVYIAQFAPVIVLMPVAWRICDRLPSRTALVLLEIASGLLTLSVGLAAWAGETTLLYALLFGRGFFDMTTKAARNVAVKSLAAEEGAAADRVVRANNLVNAASYLGQAVGALLGFLLIARTPLIGVAAINAATFALSAALCARLPLRPAVCSAQGGYRELWSRGRDALTGNPPVARAMGYLVATVVILQGFNQVARLWLPLQWLHLSPAAGAVSEAVGVAGIIAGLLIVSRFLTGDGAWKWPLSLVFIMAAVAMTSPFWSQRAEISFACYFLFMGLFEIVFMLSMNRILAGAPAADVPCLMIMFYGLAFGGMAVSALIVGAAADRWGLPLASIVLAALGAAVALSVEWSATRSRTGAAAAMDGRCRTVDE